MGTKNLWHLKQAPDNIEKTKIGQNVDADHHLKASNVNINLNIESDRMPRDYSLFLNFGGNKNQDGPA